MPQACRWTRPTGAWPLTDAGTTAAMYIGIGTIIIIIILIILLT
jgi:hypothetical protein